MEHPGEGTGGAVEGAVPVAAVTDFGVGDEVAPPDDEQPAHAAARARRPTASATAPRRGVRTVPLPPSTTVSPPGTGARGR